MRRQRWLAGMALLVLAGAAAADPPDPARELADTIDKHIRAGWDKAKVQPAPPANDAEFLRRVTLHLAGRIPTVSEVREFLADKRPDKRERAIKKLLDSPRYVTHFVNVWRSWMMPEADASIQARFLIPGFENWLRGKLQQNVPYDKLVHELLTAPVGGSAGGFVFGGGGGQASASSYYVAKELKAENLGASAARMFLGIRLECAQCHDHPFADWKRDQFWQFAAFFSGIRGQNQGDFVTPSAEQADKDQIAVGGTSRTVKARFPDGTEFKRKLSEPTRKALADWVTAPNNPYFARATVNRVWDYFFSMGLIDPVDEMVGAESINAHPELLDALAKAFVASKYDLKFLIRAITTSKTYQLSSLRAEKGTPEAKRFARFPLRGMTAEQLYDSVATATGYEEMNRNVPGVFVVGGGGSPRAEFVARFAEQTGRSTEFQTSILQALALMNGKLVENATSLDRSEILLAVTDNPFMSAEQRIETLYLAALSRPPKAKELARMMRFIEEHAPADLKEDERDKKRKQALADVFWTLLNSAEFILNH